MFTFPKIMMKMLFLGLVLLSGGTSLASPPTAACAADAGAGGA